MSSALVDLGSYLVRVAAKRVAPKLVPVLGPVYSAGQAIVALEAEIDSREYKALMDLCYREDNVIALKYIPFEGEAGLKDVVNELGGTAWIQVSPGGAFNRGRLLKLWHYRMDFRPRPHAKCPLGRVVHGSRHFNFDSRGHSEKLEKRKQ